MNKLQVHHSICAKLNTIYEAENHDYGDSFGKSYKEYGPTMSAIRLEDKLNRFKTLIKSDAKVTDENIKRYINGLSQLCNYDFDRNRKRTIINFQTCYITRQKRVILCKTTIPKKLNLKLNMMVK